MTSSKTNSKTNSMISSTASASNLAPTQNCKKSSSSPAPTQMLALSLALLVMLGSGTPSPAQTASVYEKLTGYEQMLFGQSENSGAIDKRLQKIERNLFGQASKSSTAERIEAIDRVLSGKSDSKYLPPVAPEMDRSGFAPTPKKAPSSIEGSLDELDAPSPASNQDKVKGLLRQAIEKYSQGKSMEAERLYQQVLALDFRNVDANYNLGAIAEARGDLRLADRYYSTALKNNPSDLELQDAVKQIREKLQANVGDASKPDLSKAPGQKQMSSGQDSGVIDGAPATASDRAIAAEAASSFKSGNFDDAIAKLSYLARKRPFDADTQFALGQALRGKNKPDEAVRHLRAAASLAPHKDLYVKTLNEVQSQIDEKQQTAALNQDQGPSSSSSSSSRHGQAANQDVLPFTGLADSSASRSQPSLGDMPDLTSIQDYLRRNAGSVMFGSVSDFGSSPGLGSLRSSQVGFGFPSMVAYPGSTRLKRALGSSLSGAAIGALSNRGYSGGMPKGAMRGALYGGLYGLMLGY